jgi:hypothetical protein
MDCGVDIIGDIHGHADRLEVLLLQLGYEHRQGAWRHPERTAIFVGDLIDRGPGQLRTLRLVRDMLEAGTAEAVMGNHELNAIGWATRADIEEEVRYLRPRHGSKGDKNYRQHQAFLSEVGPDSEEHRSWIEWFKSLPLWIERNEYRVVHAAWDPEAVALAATALTPEARLRPDELPRAFQAADPLRGAVDTLLKGPEVDLPAGVTFSDKDGHVRGEIRTRWWEKGLTTYREAYIGPDGVDIPDVPITAPITLPEPDRPVFIGHYWLDARSGIGPLTDLVACVDYSVAKGGAMATYRFDGEAVLMADKFVSV